MKLERLQAQDIADAVVYAVTQPDRVSVNEILIRPIQQTVQGGIRPQAVTGACNLTPDT